MLLRSSYKEVTTTAHNASKPTKKEQHEIATVLIQRSTRAVECVRFLRFPPKLYNID